MEILVGNTHHPIVYSENQGKIHAGWAMPPGAPDAVKEKMRELIEWEIRDIRETIIARRRSDSFPNEDRNVYEKIPEAVFSKHFYGSK